MGTSSQREPITSSKAGGYWLGPGVVAITLGLVGRAALAERLGQNQRFAAAGGVVVTLTMALVAYSESSWAMFVPVVLAVPVLCALNNIRTEEIDFRRASGAEEVHPDSPQRVKRLAALLKNPRLLTFAACVVLFQLANASMLPLVNGMLASEGKRQAAPVVAALIMVPQFIVALLAPWVGRAGRKTRSQTAAACRVRRSTDPRGAVCFDQ